MTPQKRSLFISLKALLVSIFGDLSWSPPRWLRASFSKVFGLGLLSAIAYLRFLEQKPKRFFALNFLVLATLVGGFFGYRWYSNLPKPSTINVMVNEIPATNLSVEKPVPNPLVVAFSGSAARIESVGKEIVSGIETQPKVAGIWKWESGSRLVFTPTNDWEVGQEYDVQLSKSLFPRHTLLEKYSFTFRSPKIIPSIASGEFYQDPTDPKIKQAVVKVTFSHAVDKSDFEKHVSVRMRVEPTKNFEDAASKKLGFKVVYSDKATEAYIRSEVVSIPEKDGEILVAIDKGVRAVQGGKGTEEQVSRTVHVPGIENFFKITDVTQAVVTNSENYAAERVMTVSSTAGVSQKELQKNVEVLLLPNDPSIYETVSDDAQAEESEEASSEGEAAEYDENSDSEESAEEEYVPDMPDNSCPWTTAGQVPEVAIKKAVKLAPTWIPAEREFATDNSFKFEADVGRCVFVRVNKGMKSFGDFQLVDTRNFVQVAKPFSQDLRITQKGSLLALNGEKKLELMARGLPAIRFTLFRVLPNSFHHLSTQGFQYDSNFAQPNFNYNFGPENISEVFVSVATLPIENPGRPQYSAFDFSQYFESAPNANKGLFILRAGGWDPAKKEAVGPSTERLVLVSNLGFLLKTFQDGSGQGYVMSTAQQTAVSGASVEVLGKNGLPIFTATTDEFGKIGLPNFKDFKFEKYPTVFVIKKDGDVSFMPYDRSDRKLNFSRFDIGGLYTERESESLQAYVFSDRGIYRPGEEAHLGLVVKPLSWKPLADKTPFELTVVDPRGIEIKKQHLNFSADGFQEFSLTVPESALTGSYTVQLSLVRPQKDPYLLGSANIRVEEFLPDRLKISANFTQPALNGWLSPDNLRVNVSLRNLYGTPAEGNTIKSRLRLSPALPSFKGWESFTFFDPFAAKNSFSEDLGELLTNESGETQIDLGLDRFEKATYQLSLSVQGLEKEGGRMVATNVSSLVSPQEYLVGWKAGGDLSFIRKGFAQRVKIAAIDRDLKGVTVDNLLLERVEKTYISVLAKQPSGSLAYQSVEKKIVRETRPFTLPQEGVELILPSDEPGNFYYELRDAHGLVLNTIPFVIVGDANLKRSMERNAELQIKLNKRDFAPDEEIEFEVQAPYVGTGLVTVERDKVYAASWFKTTTTSSMQKIRVPKELEGNGYLNVSFVRSLDSNEIFTSPLSFGIEPFSVSKEVRTERISLNVPQQILPGQKLEISASSSQKTHAVVYAIDEGILQVARYKTPDPLSHFFRKRALEVQTQQIVDLLLPEYRWVREFSAAGGDEDALLGKHRNPFKRKGQKPVIFWSGIVELTPEAKKFAFDVPDYFNGSIKVFAVSVSDQRIGVNEKQVTVQGDLVLSPNAPLFAAPGDEFDVSVVVANTKLPSGTFNISLQLDDHFQALSPASVPLEIASAKDSVAHFQLKALPSLGVSDLIFRAEGQGSSARYTIDMSVRPSSPRLDTITTGVLRSGLLGAKEQIVPVERRLYREEAQRSISFSVLPLTLANALSRFLTQYPHGCTEQVTSQAFPGLLLSEYPGLAPDRTQQQKIMNRVFSMQGARQQEGGAFVFWQGESDPTPWLNLHVGRFLLEAKDRGFSPPASLIQNTFAYLREMATQTSEQELDLDSARNRAYAIYLLTRFGEVTTSYVQTLREELEKSTLEWREDLTALFVASSYQLMQVDKDAKEFASKVGLPEFESQEEYSVEPLYSSLSVAGITLDLLSRHFPDKARKLDSAVFEKIADALAANSYSTVGSANLIMGLEAYHKLMKAQDIPTAADLLASIDGKNFAPISIPNTSLASIPLDEKVVALKLVGKSSNSIFHQLSLSGFDLPESIQQRSAGLEVFREYRNAKGQPITEANLGDDISVILSLRALGDKEYIDNLAVTDLLPTGLEISGGTQGLSGADGDSEKNWSPQFVDAREDRALLYGSVGKSLRNYEYKAKAISKGKFVIPPIQAEAMYDQKIRAVSGGGTLIIK